MRRVSAGSAQWLSGSVSRLQAGEKRKTTYSVKNSHTPSLRTRSLRMYRYIVYIPNIILLTFSFKSLIIDWFLVNWHQMLIYLIPLSLTVTLVQIHVSVQSLTHHTTIFNGSDNKCVIKQQDYCNAILSGPSKSIRNQLELMQNCLSPNQERTHKSASVLILKFFYLFLRHLWSWTGPFVSQWMCQYVWWGSFSFYASWLWNSFKCKL